MKEMEQRISTFCYTTINTFQYIYYINECRMLACKYPVIEMVTLPLKFFSVFKKI